MINELEKAKALLSNRNIKLTDLAEDTNIPYESLRTLRYDLSKVDKASYERVHTLATYYDMLPSSKKVVAKPAIFETNNYVYIEKTDKNFNNNFKNATEAVLNWQHEKKAYWKLEITDKSFDSIFDYITAVSDKFDYYFADVDGELEGQNARKIKIYSISFYIPTYDWGMTDDLLADWLMKYLQTDKDNLHLKTMLLYAEGLNSISKPLYKYVFALISEKLTRREGLINSYLLFDKEHSLADLAHWAYIHIHSKERHPGTSRKDFDPDKYIKETLESAKMPFDPDDMPY